MTNNANYHYAHDIDCGELLLSPFNLEHLDAIHQMTLEPEVQEFLSDWIATREQRYEWLTKYEIGENETFFEALPHIDHLAETPLRMAIIHKATGDFVGWIVTGFKTELPPPNREIGYAISNCHTGKGYATIAAKGMIQFLFENSETQELVATAVTYNVPSNRVLTKCGYHQEGTMDIDNKPYYYYRMTKEQWLHSNAENPA